MTRGTCGDGSDSASVALGSTFTTVRGGGNGNSAWVAKIVGLDPKWGLAREFCERHEYLSGSRASGSISFDVDEPGIYEFRGFCVMSTRNWEWSGFIELLADGSEMLLTKKEVVARFES